MIDRVIFLEEYNYESDMLLDTYKSINSKFEAVVMKDNTELPDEYTTIYEYYLRKNDKEQWIEKDIFYVFMDIPNYWEVQSDGADGIVVNNGKTMARIFFKKPIIERKVSYVDWFRDNGTLYKRDIYNKYGFVYNREFYDKNEKLLSKSYYNSLSKEIIQINYSNGCVCLFENEQAPRVFGSIDAFEAYAICNISVEKVAVFTSVKQSLIYLNGYENNDKCCEIALWKREEIEKCKNEALHMKLQCPLYMFNKNGQVYENNTKNKEYAITYSKGIYQDVNGKCEALIYTWHDDIKGIEYLIENIPEVNFHIAAKTSVSNKLMDMGLKENVFIHPGVTSEDIQKLYDMCDFYLDINIGNEVDDAVIRACMSGSLIMGVEGYLHNQVYMLRENIFKLEDVKLFSQRLKYFACNLQELQLEVKKQQEKNRDIMLCKEERE